jgi:hypothetical protein
MPWRVIDDSPLLGVPGFTHPPPPPPPHTSLSTTMPKRKISSASPEEYVIISPRVDREGNVVSITTRIAAAIDKMVIGEVKVKKSTMSTICNGWALNDPCIATVTVKSSLGTSLEMHFDIGYNSVSTMYSPSYPCRIRWEMGGQTGVYPSGVDKDVAMEAFAKFLNMSTNDIRGNCDTILSGIKLAICKRLRPLIDEFEPSQAICEVDFNDACEMFFGLLIEITESQSFQ